VVQDLLQFKMVPGPLLFKMVLGLLQLKIIPGLLLLLDPEQVLDKVSRIKTRTS
jgi:hypothetical protein